MLKTYRKYRNYIYWGKLFIENALFKKSRELTEIEGNKRPLKYEVINHLLEFLEKDNSCYLEIGLRHPKDNFDKINATFKYSVDPGLECDVNQATFKMTSDEFFRLMNSGTILDTNIRFDVIFIDGLHLAEQVEKDIFNALKFLNEDGFIVLHDCNPPMDYHARENYGDRLSFALNSWNGTVWKAFYKIRKSKEFFSCCIDTDWGVGIISKSINLGNSCTVSNDYFEYNVFNTFRKETLNLMSYDEFKQLLVKKMSSASCSY